MRTLRISDNDLFSLDMSHFPKLRTLYADGNRLSRLTRSGNDISRLENLSLRNQRCTSLRLSMSELSPVKRLYVSGKSCFSIIYMAGLDPLNVDRQCSAGRFLCFDITEFALRRSCRLLALVLACFVCDGTAELEDIELELQLPHFFGRAQRTATFAEVDCRGVSIRREREGIGVITQRSVRAGRARSKVSHCTTPAEKGLATNINPG